MSGFSIRSPSTKPLQHACQGAQVLQKSVKGFSSRYRKGADYGYFTSNRHWNTVADRHRPKHCRSLKHSRPENLIPITLPLQLGRIQTSVVSVVIAYAVHAIVADYICASLRSV